MGGIIWRNREFFKIKILNQNENIEKWLPYKEPAMLNVTKYREQTVYVNVCFFIGVFLTRRFNHSCKRRGKWWVGESGGLIAQRRSNGAPVQQKVDQMGQKILQGFSINGDIRGSDKRGKLELNQAYKLTSILSLTISSRCY